MNFVKQWIQSHPFWSVFISLMLGLLLFLPAVFMEEYMVTVLAGESTEEIMQRLDSIDRHRCEYIKRSPAFQIAKSEKPLTDFKKFIRRKRRQEQLVQKAICQSSEKIDGVRVNIRFSRDNTEPVAGVLILRNVQRQDTDVIEKSLTLGHTIVESLEREQIQIINKDGFLLYDGG